MYTYNHKQSVCNEICGTYKNPLKETTHDIITQMQPNIKFLKKTHMLLPCFALAIHVDFYNTTYVCVFGLFSFCLVYFMFVWINVFDCFRNKKSFRTMKNIFSLKQNQIEEKRLTIHAPQE